MSPTKKTLIRRSNRVGLAVIVGTAFCGAMIGLGVGSHQYGGLFHAIYGVIIGAVVGVPIWIWLGVKAYRKKNVAPNEVIPDDSTT